MMSKPRTAAIVLAAGKGSRMTATTPKVCRLINGQPAINRMLALFDAGGISPCVVVVGARQDLVRRTVQRGFPDTLFIRQPRQRGTGDATGYGLHALEQACFQGDVIVIAGDKIIAPDALERLLRKHRRTQSDLTLAVTRRAANAFNGIILQDAKSGAVRGILDEWDRRRLLVLGRLNHELSNTLSPAKVRDVIRSAFPDRKAARYFPSLWKREQPLTRRRFMRIISDPLERRGRLRVGRRIYDAATLLEHFPLANQSLYIFRFDVLQRILEKIKRLSTGPEVYLTDTVALLTRNPRRLVSTSLLSGKNDVLGFNTEQELRRVRRTLAG